MERIPSEVVDSVLSELLDADPADNTASVQAFISTNTKLESLQRYVATLMMAGPGAIPSAIVLSFLAGARMEAARAESDSLESLFRFSK